MRAPDGEPRLWKVQLLVAVPADVDLAQPRRRDEQAAVAAMLVAAIAAAGGSMRGVLVWDPADEHVRARWDDRR